MRFEFETRRECPACGSAPVRAPLVDAAFDEPPISELLIGYAARFVPGELAGRYILDDCARCGLVYQRHVPGRELLDAVYGDGSDPASSRNMRGFVERRGYSFQVEEMLKYFGSHPSDVHVLDYGMGWGNWLQMAQAYGCRAAGAELAASRAEDAVPGIEVIAPDELPAERFHFINTEQVFEHLIDPADTGVRLVAALRPGGILRVSVPNGGEVRALLMTPDWLAPKGSPRSLNAVAPLEHVNCFSHESLVSFGRQRLHLRPMHYPIRQFLEPWERIRFAVSAVAHTVGRPKGTMLLFQKP